MTMTAEREADTVTATYDGPRCQSCGGPCWHWKGSVWEYTCTDCIDRYLDEGAARWAVREAKEAEKQARKNARKLLQSNDSESSVMANGRRSDGDGPVVYRAAVGASAPGHNAPQ